MKLKTEQTQVYWIAAYVGSKWRKLGIVMVAGDDAPELIRGRRIFYRLLNWSEDLVMRRDTSIGFSKTAFEYAKKDGIRYVVTFAKEKREMNIAHVDAFTFERNYGQGVQSRARVEDTTTLRHAGLRFPTAIATRNVQDEEPPIPEIKPKITQPTLF